MWMNNRSIQSTMKMQSKVDRGYVTVGVTATTQAGKSVMSLDAPIQIHIPKIPPTGSIVAWSQNDIIWSVIPKLLSPALPDEASIGYFVESDRTITVFSRHLTSFGIRKLHKPHGLPTAKSNYPFR